MIELNKIYNMDCIEGMKLIDDNSVDLIVTDPPYELENHGGTKSKMAQRAAKVRDEIDFISNGFDYVTVFSEFMRICKVPNFIIFCSNQQVSRTMGYFEELKLSTTLLVWNKTNPSPLCNNKHISDVEFVVYVRGDNATWDNEVSLNKKYKVKKFPFENPTEKIHPTQKPLQLIKEYIELHSTKGQTILDPFMGSGTTAIACINTNRNFIGFELDRVFYNSSIKRISWELRQQTLF